MKRFALKTLLLLAILLVCDYIIGTALEYMFLQNKSGASGFILNHLQTKMYDAYIMGASDAERGYIPSILEDELGLTVFNTGEAGTSILYNYATLKLILRNSKPKLIIWDLTNADYYYRPDAAKISMITPFYRDKDIRKLLTDISPLNRIWLCSRIYPFNHKVISIMSSYLNKPKPGVDGNNGYNPVFDAVDINRINDPIKQFDDEEITFNKRTPDMQAKDKLIRHYCDAFIQLCQTNDIKLVAFYCPKAPISKKIATVPLLTGELQAKLRTSGVPLHIILPSAYAEMNNPHLFYDLSHLNAKGAKVYTTIVAHHLKSDLGK
jgi:hypothetical protein